MINDRFVQSRGEPYQAFKAKFDHSVKSVNVVADYLRKQGHKLQVDGDRMRDSSSEPDKGDIWVLKDDGTPDYRIEVRQFTKENFTSAEDFRYPLMAHYFCIDWAQLNPKPKFVFIVNKTCTHAAKITCGATVANWLVTNAPRYSSYAVPKDVPEYIAL